MATAISKKILLLYSKPVPDSLILLVTGLFTHLLPLNQYVCRHIITTDQYLLAIPRAHLEDFLDDPVYLFPQVELVYVYCENNVSYETDQIWFQNRYEKLRFCHERDLPKVFDKPTIDNAVDPSRPIDRVAINGFASSVTQRVSTKRPATANRDSPAQGHLTSTSSHGFFVKNIESINQRFICPKCELILREPYQLKCGHRICQSCINIENEIVSCLLCFTVSSSQNIWLDKGLRREMEQLLICCAVCDRTQLLKRYQEHIDHDHQEHINTADVHQTNQPSILTTLLSIHAPSNNDQHRNPLSDIRGRLIILTNIANALSTDQQRIRDSLSTSQKHLETISQEVVSLRSTFEGNVGMGNGIEVINDFVAQKIWSLNQMVEDRMFVSTDGTFVWKITSVEEKFADALSERRKSIYSPAFYSSPCGYKMCMRLYLNGDGNARGEYLSLFLVVMRGDYDAILHWPFSYKITFVLIDQSTFDHNQSNISDGFWPDVTSPCFQRPDHNMNEAYGITNFCSIESLRKHSHLYIRDNVMFIKIIGNFLEERPESLANTDMGATPNDEEHVGTINDNIMHMS